MLMFANVTRCGIREGSDELMAKNFPDGQYVDVPGLCGVATREQIEKQGWSLNPGRYVGVAAAEDDGGSTSG